MISFLFIETVENNFERKTVHLLKHLTKDKFFGNLL